MVSSPKLHYIGRQMWCLSLKDKRLSNVSLTDVREPPEPHVHLLLTTEKGSRQLWPVDEFSLKEPGDGSSVL